MGLDVGKIRPKAAAAPVSDQDHVAMARQKRLGQGLGGEHMAAGAAGSQCYGGAPGHGHTIPSLPTRRRVSARTIPTAMASAINEEPP